MAASRGPHVRELFVGQPVASKFEYEKKESKKKYNLKGKGEKDMSALGQYKPKILTADSAGNVPVPRSPQLSANRPVPMEGKTNKAFIMGDKDVPLVLEPSENIYSELDDTANNVQSTHGEQTTSNPIFNESPVRSPKVPPRYRKVTVDPIPEEIGGVEVPAPDYDEDEVTLDFGGEGNRGSVVYTEFAGEDFSRYLTDDEEDYEFDPPLTVRARGAPVSRKVNQKRSKTEAVRDKPKKDTSRSLFRPSKKSTVGRTSLRNFSVNDSKLGISVDGTVKKKSVMRQGVPMEGSYETFLKMRNGGSLESASSDSGHETGEDVFRGRDEKHSPFWKKLTWKVKKVGYSIKH